MLKHTTRKLVNAPIIYCLRCVRDPGNFLSHSKYTYTVKRIRDNVYEVVFRWVKWGMERFYRVIIEVKEEGDTVVYTSTRDSPYHFRLSFKLADAGEERTSVVVESEMKAGIMADLLGKKDYREFIEELVDKGIVGAARKIAESVEPLPGEAEPSCTDCLLYDSHKAYCYALREDVRDPRRPPCRGKYFLSRRLILGVEERS